MTMSDQKRIFKINISIAVWFQSNYILREILIYKNIETKTAFYFISAISHPDHNSTENMTMFFKRTFGLKTRSKFDMEHIRCINNLFKKIINKK